MNKTKLGFLLCFPLCCAAESAQFEIQAQAGISDVSFAGPDEIQATPVEFNTLHQTNDEASFQGSVGVGYVFPLNDEDESFIWFPDFKIALNFYGFSSDNEGDAYEFGQADLNNFTYDLEVSSRRLMLDAYLTLLAWEDWSVFALAGTGQSWNNISYNQIPNEGIPGVEVELEGNKDAAWAYEAGAGIAYAVSDNVSLSLEYLYTHFNSLQTSDSGTVGQKAVEIAPLTFDLHTNTLFFGLTWAP
jgi:opacity protein-like surface antigen